MRLHQVLAAGLHFFIMRMRQVWIGYKTSPAIDMPEFIWLYFINISLLTASVPGKKLHLWVKMHLFCTYARAIDRVVPATRYGPSFPAEVGPRCFTFPRFAATVPAVLKSGTNA